MAITFVDSTATGTDAGTSWTNAFPSLTTALAAANIAPGALVLVSGTFAETVVITEAAAATTPNIIQGDDKSGGAGAGVAADFTIDGTGLTNCLNTTLGSGTNTYYVFKNMICHGANVDGCNIANCRSVTFKDCRFHTNLGHGLVGTNTAVSVEECQFDGNGDAAAEEGCALGSSANVIGCVAFGNYASGFFITNGNIYGSLAYNNGTPGNTTANFHFADAIGCTAISNTTDGDGIANVSGIWFDGAMRALVCVNNIGYGHSGFSGVGIEWDQAISEVAISRNNLVNGNGAAYDGADTFTGEVTSAPGFTDEAGDDYSLASGSAAKAAGFDAGELNIATVGSFVDIGAVQLEEPAGGGGVKMAGAGGAMVG